MVVGVGRHIHCYLFRVGAYVRKKKRKQIRGFLKCYSTSMRKLQVSIASNCCCVSFAFTAEHHGVKPYSFSEKKHLYWYQKRVGEEKWQPLACPLTFLTELVAAMKLNQCNGSDISQSNQIKWKWKENLRSNLKAVPSCTEVIAMATKCYKCVE